MDGPSSLYFPNMFRKRFGAVPKHNQSMFVTSLGSFSLDVSHAALNSVRFRNMSPHFCRISSLLQKFFQANPDL